MRWKLIAVGAIVVAGFGTALVADLPKPGLFPPLPIAVYYWTSIYLGINGGVGTGNSNLLDGPIGTTPSTKISSAPALISNSALGGEGRT
jgi:hypothetical protein